MPDLETASAFCPPGRSHASLIRSRTADINSYRAQLRPGAEIAAHPQTFLHLTRRDGHEDTIRGFRKRICMAIGVNPSGPAAESLAHSLYLFGFADGQIPPVGMAEFFFHDDALHSYTNALHHQAYDLSKIAPLREMIHLRSLIIADEFQRSSLFLYLCAAVTEIAHDLGAHYLTAATNVEYSYVVGLHKNAGMAKLGTYCLDGSVQQLSLIELEGSVHRARRLCRRRPPIYGTELIEALKETRFRNALLASTVIQNHIYG